MENSPSPVAALTGEQRAAPALLSPKRLDELSAALLSHERRAGIKNNVEHLRDYGGMAAGDYRSHVPALLAHIEAQAEQSQHFLALRDCADAQVAELRKELAEQEVEKLALVKENEMLRKLLQAGKEYIGLTRPGQSSPFDELPAACLQDCSSCQKGETFREEARQWEEGGAYGG